MKNAQSFIMFYFKNSMDEKLQKRITNTVTSLFRYKYGDFIISIQKILHLHTHYYIRICIRI